MDYSVQRLQFLDLTDATENEQSLIERVLFSSNQALEVPWCTRRSGAAQNQVVEPEWSNSSHGDLETRQDLHTNNQIHQDVRQEAESGNEQPCGREEAQEEGNPEEEVHSDQVPPQEQIPRQGGIFPGHPPTSLPHQAQPMFQMYQMLPSLSNVYVSNVTANVNVHAPYVQPIPAPYGHQIPPQQQQQPPPQQQQQQQQQQPQQMYPHCPPEGGDQGNRNRRQRQKTDKKRDGGPFVQTNEVIPPSLERHPPPQFPSIPPIPPYYLPGAPGAPVYMQHAILPVYPSPMFGPYSHTPGPMVYPQAANNLEPGNEEYHDSVQQNFHPEGSEMVVVGCPGIRSETAPDQRRSGIEGNGSNYQIELQEQVVQEDSPGYKTGAGGGVGNVQFAGGGENQVDRPGFASQQNGQMQIENSTAGNASHYERSDREAGNKKADGSKHGTCGGEQQQQQQQQQTCQFASARKEEAINFQAELVGEMSANEKNKKTNGECEANNAADKIAVNGSNSTNAHGGHSGLIQTGPNKMKLINCASAPESVKLEGTPSPVPRQNSEFPLIGQNVKVTRSTFPQSPESSSETVSAGASPSAGPGKSWASLFNRSDRQFNANSPAENRERPLARVLPYHGAETSSGLPAEPASSVPPRPPSASTSGLSSSDVVAAAAAKAEEVAPARANGSLPRETVFVPASNLVNDPRLHNLGAFLCKYEPDHKIVSLQPRGLTNRSNWCYVNAILQSLIACPPFYNLLKALPVGFGKGGSKQTLIVDALVEYASEFSPMPANARIGKREKSARNKDESNAVEIATGSAFEPSGIYKVLDKVRGESSFNVEGRQEDAEEFLSCLLNGLNDEMFELMKMVGANHSGLTNGDANGSLEGSADDDETEWNVMGPKNKSSVTRRAVCGKTPISDIFRGQIRSRVQRAGDQSTDTVQPFFTLQLDIEKANSVKDALELFMGKDPLEGVTCSRTHQEVEAWTQTTIEDLPLILILHLKCYDYKSDACSKIIKNFEFQVDLKIDAKLLSNRNKYTGKQRNYKLVAVVYHDGKEASKGHYVTDAYHVGYGCWLRYDDVIVRSVPESHVLKPRAPRVPYLLYYRRADTIGPTK